MLEVLMVAAVTTAAAADDEDAEDVHADVVDMDESTTWNISWLHADDEDELVDGGANWSRGGVNCWCCCMDMGVGIGVLDVDEEDDDDDDEEEEEADDDDELGHDWGGELPARTADGDVLVCCWW